MSREAFERGDWRTVLEAHPLESHDPQEWLRYGVALLQTMRPGPEEGKQQQQAALAFVQAQKEGASAEEVTEAQRQSVVISLRKALSLTGRGADRQNQGSELPVQATSNESPPQGDSSISRLIQILVDLYSLQPPHNADHRSQLLALKQQLRERGIAIRSIELALLHAEQVESNLSKDSIEHVLQQLA